MNDLVGLIMSVVLTLVVWGLLLAIWAAPQWLLSALGAFALPNLAITITYRLCTGQKVAVGHNGQRH